RHSRQQARSRHAADPDPQHPAPDRRQEPRRLKEEAMISALASLERAPAAKADPATMANALRALAMDAVEAAKSGHPGMPMGMADAATVLSSRFLKFDPAAPDWPARDRFVLS